jgi:hypothetical protein
LTSVCEQHGEFGMAQMDAALPALTRAWRKSGGRELWIRVKTVASPEHALAATRRAAAVANEAEFADDRDPSAGSAGVAATPSGPVVYLGICDSPAALKAWTALFTDTLEADGISGTLEPTQPEPSPLGDRPTIRFVTAALTVPIDLEAAAADRARTERTDGWYVPPKATAALVPPLAAWCLAAAGDVFLEQEEMRFRLNPESVTDTVVAALGTGTEINIVCASAPTPFRRVCFGHRGTVTLTLQHGDWSDDVAVLTEILVAMAAQIEQGLLRRAARSPIDWQAVVNYTAPLIPYGGGLRSTLIHRLRDLLDHRVSDAYGVQVLTDAHLAHATDLSAWEVTALDGGRHLVRARDLALWFAGDAPDEAVLQRARNDFGAMVLSPDVAATEPPGPFGPRPRSTPA